jgi:hypothetical protein
MSLSVDTSTICYAVISIRNDSHRERLITAYPNEKTLRQLIAAPSILALGYASRAEAVAYREDVGPVACALRPEWSTNVGHTVTQCVTKSSAIRRVARSRVVLPTTAERIR